MRGEGDGRALGRIFGGPPRISKTECFSLGKGRPSGCWVPPTFAGRVYPKRSPGSSPSSRAKACAWSGSNLDIRTRT